MIVKCGLGKSRSNLWIFALLCGMILANGCVFTPRDPETPDDTDTEWVSPTEPMNVLANIAFALAAKTTTNYENSLDDDFTFFPDGGDYGDYFAIWDFDKEMKAIEELYTLATAIDIQWGDIVIDAQSSDLNILEADNYQMTITYLSGEQVVFGGGAHFYMSLSGGIWKLEMWDESVNTSGNSGGQLRKNLNIEN
ncbi:MAG: hypothetical protein GY835_14055 [bacterium]|nr:hypothetical protein [bacterium]